MATIKRRYHRFDAKIRIPAHLRERYGGRVQLEKRLSSTDKRTAQAEGQLWEASLRLEWSGKAAPEPTRPQLREVYERQRLDADSTQAHGYYGEKNPVVGGIDFQIEQLADEWGRDSDLSPMQEAQLAGLQDARKAARGKPVAPRPELEPSLSETTERYMIWWKGQKGLKESNTEQQKRATYRLFAGFWHDRPIREVLNHHASDFMDTIRRLDPLYARSPAARQMSWDQLLTEFGSCDAGLGKAGCTLSQRIAR